MPKPRAVFAASVFAVVTGLIVWASVSREPLQEKSLFDAAESKTDSGATSITPPSDESALAGESPSKSTPSSSLDRTVRSLKDDVGAIGHSPTSETDNAVKSADDAIARADAALSAAGVSPPKTAYKNNASSEKLTALQARLDRLRD